MRKIFLFATITLLTTGCMQEITHQAKENELQELTFHARQENSAASKSYIEWVSGGNYEIRWSAGDCIALYDGTAKRKFTLKSGAETTSGVFTGLAEPAAFYAAVYPYRESAVFSGNSVSAQIPDIQKAVFGTIADGCNLAVAKSEGKQLNFKNVCSMIAFKPSEEIPDCAYVELKGNNQEILSGDVRVDFSGDVPVATVVNGKTTVRIDCKDSGLKAGNYYCCVLPQVFEKGFTISFYDADDMLIFKRSNKTSVNAERSHLLVFGKIPVPVNDKLMLAGKSLNFVEKKKCYSQTISFTKGAEVTFSGFKDMQGAYNRDFFSFADGKLTFLRESGEWTVEYYPECNYMWVFNNSLAYPDCLYVLGSGKVSCPKWYPNFGWYAWSFYERSAPYYCVVPKIADQTYQTTMYLSTDAENEWRVALELYSDINWGKTAQVKFMGTDIISGIANRFEILNSGQDNCLIHGIDTPENAFVPGYYRFTITTSETGSKIAIEKAE